MVAEKPDVGLGEVACAWLNHYTRLTFQVIVYTHLVSGHSVRGEVACDWHIRYTRPTFQAIVYCTLT